MGDVVSHERGGRFLAEPVVVALLSPGCRTAADGDGGGGHAATFRGRPRGLFRAMTTPWSKISPPQTPHGSLRSSAPARQAALAGHSAQSTLARSRSSGFSAKNRSGSPLWQGRSSDSNGSIASLT